MVLQLIPRGYPLVGTPRTQDNLPPYRSETVVGQPKSHPTYPLVGPLSRFPDRGGSKINVPKNCGEREKSGSEVSALNIGQTPIVKSGYHGDVITALVKTPSRNF